MRQLEDLGRRVAELERQHQQPSDTEPAVVDDRETEWGPPRRGRGIPDAGVVTLELQPDEEHAFGPAAALVAEWRELRAGNDNAGSRVDQVRARVRRWELEAELLRDFLLTLPPETMPLDQAGREEHIRRWQEALAEARRELRKARRARLLKRALTLGL